MRVKDLNPLKVVDHWFRELESLALRVALMVLLFIKLAQFISTQW